MFCASATSRRSRKDNIDNCGEEREREREGCSISLALTGKNGSDKSGIGNRIFVSPSEKLQRYYYYHYPSDTPPERPLFGGDAKVTLSFVPAD